MARNRSATGTAATAASTVADAADTAPSTKAVRLPGAGRLLIAQVRYQIRLLLSSGRGDRHRRRAAGYLAGGLQGQRRPPQRCRLRRLRPDDHRLSTYGVRLVAAREEGVLKRWRATPLPRPRQAFRARALFLTQFAERAGDDLLTLLSDKEGDSGASR